jgi:hypothetical protein
VGSAEGVVDVQVSVGGQLQGLSACMSHTSQVSTVHSLLQHLSQHWCSLRMLQCALSTVHLGSALNLL